MDLLLFDRGHACAQAGAAVHAGHSGCAPDLPDHLPHHWLCDHVQDCRLPPPPPQGPRRRHDWCVLPLCVGRVCDIDLDLTLGRCVVLLCVFLLLTVPRDITNVTITKHARAAHVSPFLGAGASTDKVPAWEPPLGFAGENCRDIMPPEIRNNLGEDQSDSDADDDDDESSGKGAGAGAKDDDDDDSWGLGGGDKPATDGRRGAVAWFLFRVAAGTRMFLSF